MHIFIYLNKILANLDLKSSHKLLRKIWDCQGKICTGQKLNRQVRLYPSYCNMEEIKLKSTETKGRRNFRVGVSLQKSTEGC